MKMLIGCREFLFALVLSMALVLLGCGDLESGAKEDSGEEWKGQATSPLAPSPLSDPTKPESSLGDSIKLVLLISLDTLRADHLGLYGYERFTSPVLDEIARESVVFEDASAPAPWTLPSHASLFTGLFPKSHGVTSAKSGLPQGIPTLAKLMANQGFQTGAIVNTPWLKQESFRLTRDFDEYFYVKPVANQKTPSKQITDRAMEWLGDLGDERMFLFLHYFDVHSDYASLPEFERLFDEPYDGQADGTSWQLRQATLEESYLEMCQTEFNKSACTLGGGVNSYVVDHTVEKIFYDDADIRHLKNLYDSGVRQLDTELTRLFGFLKKKELLDKTLLIIVSDHGEAFGEHGEVDHFLNMYQELLHVPLVIRGPGVARGKRIAAPVSLIDIVPTILRQVDAPLPDTLDGLDLTPLWHEGAKGETRRTFDERFLYGEASGGITWSLIAEGHYPIYRSVRRGPYKMVHRDQGDRYELFDLESDPEESVNIAAKKPQILAELKKEMAERYSEFSAMPSDDHKVEIDEEDAEALRALGYIQ